MDGPLDPEDPLKPLHRCNFYGSKEAGNKLDSMLKLGASKPWKDAMEVRNMFALLLFYYFIMILNKNLLLFCTETIKIC